MRMKILIPCKTESIRCPRKNFRLLPFVAKWLKNEGVLCDAVAICDGNEMMQLALECGLQVFCEVHPRSGDIQAVSDCATAMGLESFVWLPLTQPLRSHGLVGEMIHAYEGVNLVVSAQEVADRSLFYVGRDGFESDSYERKGCMCEEKLMVDGAAYVCRTEWLRGVRTNHDFWNEPFNIVINHAPFLDVDTEDDMRKFETICRLKQD